MNRVREARSRRRDLRRAHSRGARAFHVLASFTLVCAFASSTAVARALIAQELTPLQHEIKVQVDRLSSADAEERRDAVTRLGAMGRPEASRAAAAALGDRVAIVRATAARAVLSLGGGEAAKLILPLLGDRDEFVRREAAYALGLARGTDAVPGLITLVESDKKPSVRAAAAVALGQIGDSRAVAALSAALSRRVAASGFFKRAARRKVEEDEFVRRASAVSLGQIGSREGVPALIEALSNEKTPGDIRREAARALGLVGDSRAVLALRSALTSKDPYLSDIAFDALRKIDRQSATKPG